MERDFFLHIQSVKALWVFHTTSLVTPPVDIFCWILTFVVDDLVLVLYAKQPILSCMFKSLFKTMLLKMCSFVVWIVRVMWCYTFLCVNSLFGFVQDSIFSAVTSLYIVSRILQVVGGRSLINFIAGVILYPYLASSKEDASQVNNCDGTSGSDSFSRYMSKLEAVVYVEFDSEGTENINGDNSLGCLVGYKSCDSPSVSCNDYKICTKRSVD